MCVLHQIMFQTTFHVDGAALLTGRAALLFTLVFAWIHPAFAASRSTVCAVLFCFVFHHAFQTALIINFPSAQVHLDVWMPDVVVRPAGPALRKQHVLGAVGRTVLSYLHSLLRADHAQSSHRLDLLVHGRCAGGLRDGRGAGAEHQNGCERHQEER